MLRRALAPLATIALLLLSLGAVAAPASAHDQLISSNPADGETLTTAPAEIVLTYNNEVAQIGAEVQITDPENTVVTEIPTISGTSVTVPLWEDTVAGAYSVAWRVTSSDGHPIDGEFSFTLDLPAPESPTAEPTTEAAAPPESATESESATETATETTAPDPTDVASATAEPEEPATDDSPLGMDMPGWVMALVALGIVGGVVALIVRMRRGTGGTKP